MKLFVAVVGGTISGAVITFLLLGRYKTFPCGPGAYKVDRITGRTWFMVHNVMTEVYDPSEVAKTKETEEKQSFEHNSEPAYSDIPEEKTVYKSLRPQDISIHEQTNQEPSRAGGGSPSINGKSNRLR